MYRFRGAGQIEQYGCLGNSRMAHVFHGFTLKFRRRMRKVEAASPLNRFEDGC